MTFIIETKIHFVHIWGIEFLIYMATMLLVSIFYPSTNSFKFSELQIDDMIQWRYTKPLSISLCFITVLIYIMLGSF